MTTRLILSSLCFLLTGCPMHSQSSPGKAFKSYWYNGEAEITSFDLQQARYGHTYPGQAVMIFVTEDFSKAKQVKLDHPDEAGNDRINVLKLNLTKKFNTGIYPYSMMLSSYLPVEKSGNPHALKVTGTTQEWCGQTFTQLNRKEDGYRMQSNSYFETEGDQQTTIPGNYWLEDELWQQIRIDPDELPVGTVDMVPGILFARLRHERVEPHRAEARFVQEEATNVKVYHLRYVDITRELVIYFKADFPYRILRWKEITENGFGKDKSVSTTEAIRKETIRLDYWDHHFPEDSIYRQRLKLSSGN
ncbi:MAG: hypothetical protein KDC57_01290 [Saprospiraceae bacterium]|nr:hypothetical protein [Saprospiraceae bacterium]